MDGRDLIARFIARWRLMIVIVVLAALIGVAVAVFTPSTYTAQAGALVLPPAQQAEGQQRSNPLASLDNSAVQLASTLVYIGQSEETASQVERDGGGGGVEVENSVDEFSQSTPFLRIHATGSTAPEARSSAQVVLQVLQRRLDEIQQESGVPPQLQIKLDVVVPPEVGQVALIGQLKTGGLAGLVALLLGLVVVALIDRYRTVSQEQEPAGLRMARAGESWQLARPGDEPAAQSAANGRQSAESTFPGSA